MNVGAKIAAKGKKLLAAVSGGGEKVYYGKLEIVPEEKTGLIRIVPVGKFTEHHNGEHEVTFKAVKEMAENLKNQSTGILFDYGHNSLWDGGAPAAGWSDPQKAEAREDGLYISYPVFTERAAAKVAAREYRGFSPVYILNGKDKQGNNAGARLISVALTNTPYFDKEIDHIKNTQQQMRNGMNPTEEKPGVPAKEPETKPSAEERLTALEEKVNALSGTPSNKSEAIVNAAVEQGKILPADKEVWLEYAAKDPGACSAKLNAKGINSALPVKLKINAKTAGSVNVADAAEYLKAAGRG